MECASTALDWSLQKNSQSKAKEELYRCVSFASVMTYVCQIQSSVICATPFRKAAENGSAEDGERDPLYRWRGYLLPFEIPVPLKILSIQVHYYLCCNLRGIPVQFSNRRRGSMLNQRSG